MSDNHEEEKDRKFWKNMGIMLVAKVAFVTVGVILTVNYNAQFYS